MTVGYELAKLTGFRLFHNHMTIELVLNFFDFEQPQFHTLVSEFRRRVFEEVAASDLPGLIFTFVWALDLETERAYIERSCDIFREKGAEIYFVELEAELTERLKRNKSEFRLSQKPSKQNVEKTGKLLLEHNEKYKMNTDSDFFYKDNYLKINNTNLPADETARMIVDRFGFSGSLTLIELTTDFEAEFHEMVEEFRAAGDLRYEPAPEDFPAYLELLLNATRGLNLRPGIVPQNTFWLVRNGRILGRSKLRHWLTPELEHEGGHIGYDIRPSERRKGYGTMILKLTLEKARDLGLRRVLLTCDSENIGSARIIEKNGGKLSGDAVSNRSGMLISQYWIEI